MRTYRWVLVSGIIALGILAAAVDSSALSLEQLMQSGTPAAIQAAIKAGTNIETPDKDGATPLMIAAGFNQDPEVISVLLKAGAKLDDHARGNLTALMYAAMNRNPAIISGLLKAGAKLDETEFDGQTPLMIAAGWNRNPQVISALLKSGANIEDRDFRGMTPLMWAAFNPNPAIMDTLLKAGANIADRDKKGMTALMWAAQDNRNPQAVSLLLNSGATGNLKSNDGKTAYDYAQFNPILKGTKVLQDLKSHAVGA